MFHFGKSEGMKELEALLAETESDMSNNYKDAAQEDFLRFESRFEELKAENGLKNREFQLLEMRAEEFRKQLKGYTHREQKASWGYVNKD